MGKRSTRIWSMLLVIIMIFNMLPVHALAEETKDSATDEKKAQEYISTEDVYVVEEIVDRRTEYTKVFQLSNGLHIASVYASPVHYEVDGQWAEIDNTLQLSNTRSGNAYINTAGVWQVSFPESMTENNGVTITKDGYVFNFRMAGELHDTANEDNRIVESEIIEIPTVPEEPIITDEVQNSTETIPSEGIVEVPGETVVQEEKVTEALQEETEVESTDSEVSGETVAPSEDTTEVPDPEDVSTAPSDVESENSTEAVPEKSEDESTDNEVPMESNPSDEEVGSDEMQTEDDTETVPEQVPEEKETVPEQVPEEQETEEETEDTAMLTAPEDEVIASIESINLEEIKANAEYPETVVEKISSRLSYDGIYEDTDVIFDLNSNQVKESIVLKAYREDLKGYIYALEVGDLTPVLLETGEVELRDAVGEEVIMYMPAPYLIDDAGATCFDVNVSLEGENGKYVLAYELPLEWLADSERQWPVILDPAVLANTDVSNIKDTTVYSKTYLTHTKGILALGYYTNRGLAHSYIKYQNLPELTAADVIVNASLTMYKPYDSATVTSTIEVHKVTSDWASETITWDTQPSMDTTVEDFVICKAAGFYSWDITDIARSWYEDVNYGLMLKYPDAEESVTTATWKEFYSSEGADYRYLPNVLITFRNNNGLESYWDYTTSSAGRAGIGYVNQYTGNLVWIRDDIGFGGNRMPVTISHVYNANDSTENQFGMGYGWRTNFNQRVYHWDEDTSYGDYYVWEDSDGTDHYFLKETSSKYKDEDGLELTLTIHGSGTSAYYLITDKYGNTSKFDNYGRLVRQENNQETKSSINITYSPGNGQLISEITDGANRVYKFVYYSDNLLRNIQYYGTGDTLLSYISFGYSSNRLTGVVSKGSDPISYSYGNNNLLVSATDVDGYTISYEYTTMTAGLPNRIKKINEKSNDTLGGVLSIEYAHNQTKFTDYNGNVQIVQFNNMGNTVSIQDDQGRAQYAQYAINDPTNPDDAATAVATTRTSGTAKGNQLLLASKLQNTVGNVLVDSSFENGTLWGRSHSNRVSRQISTTESFLGNKSLAMTHTGDGVESALISPAFTVEPGEAYTFSAYVKCGEGDAYLCMSDGSVWPKSEILSAGSDWTRLQVSYTNTGTTTKEVKARFQTSLPGTSYIDCVQVEKAPTASRYNLIQNGDFRTTASWNPVSGRTTTGTENIEKVPASQLDTNVYKMTGNPQGTNRISQTVAVSGDEGDTFVLAGWAKADSVQLIDNRKFSLIATFKNGNATVNTTTVNFNPCADSTISWQYAASPIIAGGAYTSIVVEVAYDYNANTAYFDGIQLYKEEFGNSYTYDEKGNIISVKDLQSQNTTYKFDANDNLVEEILPSGAKLTYKYDTHHNVTKATTSTGVVYDFTYDAYGNNTSVSITSGTQSISSSAQYTDDKNRLYSTTDATGNTTLYDYDENTNVLKSVQYPQDTADSKTTYTYDNMYRLASAAANVKIGTASAGTMSAEYEYENDLLKSITTGSTEYSFNYTDFALRSNIKIGNRTLASYIYKGINDTNAGLTGSKFADAPIHSLLGLDYGNGDKVQYTYDKQGRLKTQEYYEENNSSSTPNDKVTYMYDNDGKLALVEDSDSGITTKYYYDFIGRLVKFTDKNNDFSRRVEYFYNEKNQLSTKSEFFGDVRHNTYYKYDDDNRQTMAGTSLSQRRYTYDSSGRQNQRKSTYNGTAVLTETFGYDSANRVSSLTKLSVKDGVSSTSTYNYEYDDNGNITSVIEGTNTTKYTYDSANQLIREDNPFAGKTYGWTYDNAGNITKREEYDYTTAANPGNATSTVHYTYGDADWGDLLTKYDGQQIIYDTIGNPTSYYNGTRWTMTWEHGRELATISDGSTTWTNTYDANGLRTKRTSGTTTYRYHYTDGLLATMNIGNDVEMWFMYDGNGPMVIKYGNAESHQEYHYELNLQGDVVAIISTSGERVVTYSYDAWGNVIDIDGSAKDTIGVHNPLRYRGYVYDTETTLYYLQSRYYDPKIGRFLNADAFASTGQGLLGNNMFAYCSNNPANSIDSLGLWTISLSGTASAVLGLGISVSFGVAFDDNWNFDWQYSYIIPGVDDTAMVGIAGVGAGIALQYTKADTVYDLYGPATYVGASAGPGWYVGGDIVSFSDASNPEMTTDGFQLVAGVGVGVDVHVAESYTRSVVHTNRPAQSSFSGSSSNRVIYTAMLY